jgi:hypothetical protein
MSPPEDWTFGLPHPLNKDATIMSRTRIAMYRFVFDMISFLLDFINKI